MKISKNPFDEKLEEFCISLLKIEGMQDALRESDRARVILFQIKSVSSLNNFKSLIINTYIPHAITLANESKKAISRSKYREYFENRNWDDGVSEIVRIGYVTLYHKFENYRNDLIAIINERLRKINKRDTSFEVFLKKTFKFDIYNLKHFPPTLNRINWISNCEKHYGGYPRKQNPPEIYKDLDQTKQIIISPEDLKKDIDFVADFFSRLFKASILAGVNEHLAEKFDKSDENGQLKFAKAVSTIIPLSFLFFKSLKEDSDELFLENLEHNLIGIGKYVQKKYQPA